MDYEYGELYQNIVEHYHVQSRATAFVIGRFQPFHDGHKALIERALELSPHVVVFVGSVQESRTEKNPFTYEERRAMIKATFGSLSERITVAPLKDFTRNDPWVSEIKQNLVDLGYDPFYCTFVCCDKDEDTTLSNQILDCFHTVSVEQPRVLNATDIRKQLFVDNISPLLVENISVQTKLIINYLSLKIKEPKLNYFS